MAQPLQYQSQFIPTDFGTVGNMLGMFRQDMAQRDQMFDQAVAMEQKLLSDLYGLETFQPEVIGQRVNKLAERMQEAVARRGGDYGAAAKDIARLGTRELSDPIYKLNQRQVEQAKLLERAQAANPNLLVLKDPRTMGLSSNMALEDIGYEVVDPANIRKVLDEMYGGLRNRVEQTDLRPSGTPGYLESTITKGATPEEITALAQDPNTLSAVISGNPQLAKYLENPNISSWLKNQIQEGLKQLEGGSEKRFVSDREWEMAMRKKAEETGSPTYELPGSSLSLKTGYSGIDDIRTSAESGDKKANKLLNLYDSQFKSSKAFSKYEPVINEKNKLEAKYDAVRKNPQLNEYIDTLLSTKGAFDIGGERPLLTPAFKRDILQDVNRRTVSKILSDEVDSRRWQSDKNKLQKALESIGDAVIRGLHIDNYEDLINYYENRDINIPEETKTKIKDALNYAEEAYDIYYKKDNSLLDYNREFEEFVDSGITATPRVHSFTDPQLDTWANNQIKKINLNNYDVMGFDEKEWDSFIDKDNTTGKITIKDIVDGKEKKRSISSEDLEYVGVTEGDPLGFLKPAIQVKIKGTDKVVNLYPKEPPVKPNPNSPKGYEVTNNLFRQLIQKMDPELGSDLYNSYLNYFR